MLLKDVMTALQAAPEMEGNHGTKKKERFVSATGVEEL